jgi:hypothetical protein
VAAGDGGAPGPSASRHRGGNERELGFFQDARISPLIINERNVILFIPAIRYEKCGVVTLWSLPGISLV